MNWNISNQEKTGFGGKMRLNLFRNLHMCLLASGMFIFSGCGAFSVSHPPEYYQIDYPFQPLECAKPFSGAVRVWSFSATAPFDREQMIVVTPSQSVRCSSNYHWVATPGNMLADKLIRDLALGIVFEDTVPVGNPIPPTYMISGQIYKFALEENGPSPCATLNVEVSLWQENPVRKVLFRKNFHYKSAPLTGPDPKIFASAMSKLVAQLSLDLRSDLCILTKDSLHPAGG